MQNNEIKLSTKIIKDLLSCTFDDFLEEEFFINNMLSDCIDINRCSHSNTYCTRQSLSLHSMDVKHYTEQINNFIEEFNTMFLIHSDEISERNKNIYRINLIQKRAEIQKLIINFEISLSNLKTLDNSFDKLKI